MSDTKFERMVEELQAKQAAYAAAVDRADRAEKLVDDLAVTLTAARGAIRQPEMLTEAERAQVLKWCDDDLHAWHVFTASY